MNFKQGRHTKLRRNNLFLRRIGILSLMAFETSANTRNLKLVREVEPGVAEKKYLSLVNGNLYFTTARISDDGNPDAKPSLFAGYRHDVCAGTIDVWIQICDADVKRYVCKGSNEQKLMDIFGGADVPILDESDQVSTAGSFGSLTSTASTTHHNFSTDEQIRVKYGDKAGTETQVEGTEYEASDDEFCNLDRALSDGKMMLSKSNPNGPSERVPIDILSICVDDFITTIKIESTDFVTKRRHFRFREEEALNVFHLVSSIAKYPVVQVDLYCDGERIPCIGTCYELVYEKDAPKKLLDQEPVSRSKRVARYHFVALEDRQENMKFTFEIPLKNWTSGTPFQFKSKVTLLARKKKVTVELTGDFDEIAPGESVNL